MLIFSSTAIWAITGAVGATTSFSAISVPLTAGLPVVSETEQVAVIFPSAKPLSAPEAIITALSVIAPVTGPTLPIVLVIVQETVRPFSTPVVMMAILTPAVASDAFTYSSAPKETEANVGII